jgi:c-di-GMP phosphodiesterase
MKQQESARHPLSACLHQPPYPFDLFNKAPKRRKGNLPRGLVNCTPITAMMAPTMTQPIYLARQAIFNRQLQVVAYELLFRSGEGLDASDRCGDEATQTVLLNTFTNLGIELVAGSDKIFVNLTRNLILHAHTLHLPPESVVIEVLEDVVVDERLLQALTVLKQKGHTIALDDFVFHDHLTSLVALADIIKCDIKSLSTPALEAQLEKLKAYPVTLLAEKVETKADFEACQQYGFHLFQGYYLSRPYLLTGFIEDPS